MENLTRQNGIVRDLEGPRPLSGYSLVVFREDHGVAEHYQTLQDGERFRPSLIESLKKRFVARAVTANAALRYRFQFQARSGGGVESECLILTACLVFKVHSPATVAAGVADDPLYQLRNEIESVLTSEALRIRPDEANNEAFDLEGALLHVRGFSPGARSDGGNFDQLRSFASTHGFDLSDIKISRQPTGDVVEGATCRAIEQTKRYKIQETTKTELAAVKAKSPIEIQKEQDEADRELRRAQTRQTIQGVIRKTRSSDQLAKRFDEALGKVAQNTDSARSLRETIDLLKGLRIENEPETPQSSSPDALPKWANVSGLPPGPPPTSENEGSLLDEIQSMRSILVGLDCRPSERTELGALILHLLAELSRGERADDVRLSNDALTLQEYLASIGLENLVQDAEQHAYFHRLQDLQKMKQSFASRGRPAETIELEAADD